MNRYPRALMDAMLKHMPIGVAIYDAQSLRLIDANELFHTFLNPHWRNGRAMGHAVTDWFPEKVRKEAEDILRAVAETGTPFHTDAYEVIAVDRGITYWDVTITPIRNKHGHVVQLLQVINEVTAQMITRQQVKHSHDLLLKANHELENERKRQEQLHAIAEHEHARLLSVLDQLPEGVMIVEAADRCISYANIASSHIFGIAHAVLSGTTPEKNILANAITYLNGQAVPGDDLPLNRALCGEYISGRETMATRHDGKQIFLLSSAAPLKDATGTITGAVTVFQDISVRKSIEQQKNMFLSVASHELRTPITAIQGFAEILHMQVSQGISLDTPRSGRAITGITEQSQRLTRLIESMLDLSRIEKAQLFVNLAEHDLLAIIQHVLETQTITNKNHLIRFTLEGLKPTDKLLACIDEDRIDQVLNNLIGNAIKYSPANSLIEVGLRYSPDSPNEILLWVRDQGIGIAANELPFIFERFHRASNLDRSISGLGIGLYLVNELVTRHGGRVWAESVEGRGSTFYVSLPLHPTQAQR